MVCSPEQSRTNGKLLLTALVEAAQVRLSEITAKELEIEKHDQAIDEAEITSKGLRSTELFAKYEQHITKQLTEALDQLSTYQEHQND